MYHVLNMYIAMYFHFLKSILKNTILVHTIFARFIVFCTIKTEPSLTGFLLIWRRKNVNVNCFRFFLTRLPSIYDTNDRVIRTYTSSRIVRTIFRFLTCFLKTIFVFPPVGTGTQNKNVGKINWNCRSEVRPTRIVVQFYCTIGKSFCTNRRHDYY